MPIDDYKAFEDKLADLSNWQVEQQKKLKAFQETQRLLLDFEHQKVLNSLNTQNFNQKYERNKEDFFKKVKNNYDIKSSGVSKEFENSESANILKVDCENPIKINDARDTLFGAKAKPFMEHVNDELNKNFEESLETRYSQQPKKFLKRGDGLARFRMRIEDFKNPPKIYKEKKIKTYLNSKPEFNCRNINSKIVKPAGEHKANFHFQSKSNKSVPVKIFTNKKCSTLRSSEPKQNCMLNIKKKCNDVNFSKLCRQNLTLQPSDDSVNSINEREDVRKEEAGFKTDFAWQNSNLNIKSCQEIDVEKKKDEKELKIFEILEQKVTESSFCSTSSIVDKLMEHSLSSTPKLCMENDEQYKKSYTQGLKGLRSKFLNEDQLKKLEGLNDFLVDHGKKENTSLEENVVDRDNVIVDEVKVEGVSDEILNKVEKSFKEETENFDEPELLVGVENIGQPVLPVGTENDKRLLTHKTNKTVLQEYIKNFKKFKHIVSENEHKMEQPKEEAMCQNPKEKEQMINQQEINLRLQRKGLQDNVKQILNWECTSRRRQPKRGLIKNKLKPLKSEKSKAPVKEDGENIIFDSTLIKLRLDELEKEINIFRRENKKWEKLQKEFNEEKIKLTKEKKEFEKFIEEEKEKFEVRMTEEQKKLQRDKNVFEKYCKQVKSHPSKIEREELAVLKKEIEKLKEILATKESRWSAAQARLRNQIKSLEKENSELKNENEKLSKFSSKKVTFEKEKNINAKIINAINSELGKLKSLDINPCISKIQPSSARLSRSLGEKPIRRIKSAPNIKKTAEVEVRSESSKESDDKCLGSVSADSGIETSGLPCEPHLANHLSGLKGNVSLPRSGLDSKENLEKNEEHENRCQSPLFVQPNREFIGTNHSQSSSSDDRVESVVREAVFGSGLSKKRDLTDSDFGIRRERTKSLNKSKENLNICSARKATLSKRASSICDCSRNMYLTDCDDEHEEEGDDISYEFKRDGIEENKPRIINCHGSIFDSSVNSSFESSSFLRNYFIESKIDENGIREKIFDDGTKEIRYPNGNVKTIFPGSKIVKMVYYNGDVKETNIMEGSEKYYYAETKTWHTTYKDGLEVLEFPNGQTERRHPNGSMEISFPNGCVRYCNSLGRDEWRFLDGTVIKTDENGHKVLLLPNGQKEIYTKEFKRREYPDGTVKILYADGSQETRYASGRVRLKSKDGNLLMDSGGL